MLPSFTSDLKKTLPYLSCVPSVLFPHLSNVEEKNCVMQMKNSAQFNIYLQNTYYAELKTTNEIHEIFFSNSPIIKVQVAHTRGLAT